MSHTVEQSLLEILNLKRRFMTMYYQATKKISKAISDEDIHRLEKVLHQKNALIQELDEIQVNYEVLHQQILDKNGIKDINSLSNLEPLNIEIIEVTNEISNLMNESYRLEKEAEELCKDKLNTFSIAIRKINEGKKVTKGYGDDIKGPASAFIDYKR